MSTVDRAFIRAYGQGEAVETGSPRSIVAAEHGVGQRSPSPPESQTRMGAGQRRPLSTFTQAPRPVEAKFQPALEVPRFQWPQVSDRLIGEHRSLWKNAVAALLAADDHGRSLIGVAATGAGLGTTTIAAALARLLVDAGKTVAVVDANFAAAGLAFHLGLKVEIGWEDVLAGNVPLAEAVVQSCADRIAALPLIAGGATAAEKLDSVHASVTAGVLRYHYDIVLFDLGDVSHSVQGSIARRATRQCRLDGAIVVVDALRAAASPALPPELDSVCLGLIENQVPRAA